MIDFKSSTKFIGILTGGGGGCVWIPLEIITIYGHFVKSTGVIQ